MTITIVNGIAYNFALNMPITIAYGMTCNIALYLVSSGGKLVVYDLIRDGVTFTLSLHGLRAGESWLNFIRSSLRNRRRQSDASRRYVYSCTV